jgi:hypothetical protein
MVNHVRPESRVRIHAIACVKQSARTENLVVGDRVIAIVNV